MGIKVIDRAGEHYAGPLFSGYGPPPESWEALRGHSVIGYDQETHFIRSISRRWPQLQPDMFTLRSNSDLAHLALIRAGAGIGMCKAGLARQNPELIRVLPTLFSLQFPTWVTMHEDLRSNPACKTVFDALISGMERYINTANSDNVT
ncbi:LysR substrate-binding domain-containing protein [Pantoea sp. A4]|uniref:LysR substrate-binding domain-containing protein n=1 Tax=Pantoea sp. A4 TaxID=1225184 RepID=UPI000374E43C|nr:LysR substrate-binding domain-containing protein [Pantoea sp. A4]